jgi:hypothetical protein
MGKYDEKIIQELTEGDCTTQSIYDKIRAKCGRQYPTRNAIARACASLSSVKKIKLVGPRRVALWGLGTKGEED